jgi:hypothetical protein
MGGGLMQLVAYGAQDIYLTGNPQITFFKVVYRRHTNFSMESIQQTLNGYKSENPGRFTSTISRNGDLIHKCYFEMNCSAAVISPNPGAAWIKTATLEIGGQQIDKITGKWMEVWAELTEPNSTGTVGAPSGSNGLWSQVENVANLQVAAGVQPTKFQRMSGMGGVGGNLLNEKVLVPLPFWFCRNAGLSLPLIALQYHEVKLTVEHTEDQNTVQLYVDYIYLDTDERRRFAQVSHEYLIEQLQYQSMDQTTQRLNFNHPVKELIWVNTKETGDNSVTPLFNASLLNGTWSLKLNGHDRFSARTGEYFARQQVYDYHTGYGSIEALMAGSASDTGYDAIFVYSFALKPEEHQPSGTCNFSRIDSAILECKFDTLTSMTGVNVTIFAVNYNVLRIMSGMGGLAYSN